MHKVVYLIDTLQTGGAEKSLLAITSSFKKYQPIFFQIFPGDGFLVEIFKSRGIEVKQFGLTPGYNFKNYAFKILPDVMALQPALIHTTLFRSDMVGRQLSKLTGLPLINSFVNNTYSKQRYQSLSMSGKLKLAGIQFWDRFTATRATLFVSNSIAIKKTNAKALKISLDKIEVIYRGRSIRDFSDVKTDDVASIRESMGLRGKQIFLNVSRLLDRKGQLDLIRAFKRVHQEISDSVLLIAGEGSYRVVLESEISNLNLHGSVKLLGDRKDIPLLLNVADIFVFPSYYEGLPGALIEAMFANIPIIASAIQENLECVDEEKALLFEPGDVEGLANQMMNAMVDNDWTARKQKAFKYAVEHFEITKIAGQYEALYDKLLTK